MFCDSLFDRTVCAAFRRRFLDRDMEATVHLSDQRTLRTGLGFDRNLHGKKHNAIGHD